MRTNEKISCLRTEMKQNGVNAYIIPSNDPHMSEYVSEYWKSRQYFSGFTGSAGTLVITESKSKLWTDGRYYIQAEKELLGSEIGLFKLGEKGVPNYIEYLAGHLEPGQCVGIDGRLFSANTVLVMQKILGRKKIKLKTSVDLVEPVWQDRPKVELSTVYLHETCFTGLSAKEKLSQVKALMREKDLDGYVLSDLASIAWLFNIRGADIPYNPMVIAYAYISQEAAYLFIDGSRLPIKVSMNLKAQGIIIKRYEEIDVTLKEISKPSKVLCSQTTLNYHLYELADKNLAIKIVDDSDLIMELKAIKNTTEINNIRNAQIKDGCALVKFMVKLETSLNSKEVITEYDLIDWLKVARLEQEGNKGESFASIVAYKENAAMMHYAPTISQHKVLKKEGLLLIDSGGQYLDGTTDITRTFALGPVSDEEKLHYTLVLKSHIQMAKAIFMEGCTGGNLDILARGPIWAYGLDYKCGTGHGVGYMLGVHEGPQSLRMKNQVPLKKGMIVTNEPGIYKAGSHGIRTENMMLVTDYKTTEDGVFYRFETLTYFPIDIKPICMSLLNQEEVDWLNQYHELVYRKLAPRLDGACLKWLEASTRPIYVG